MTIENANQHTIFVSGATGQQGGAVTRHLLRMGFRVRALTRNPGKPAARALADEGANVVAGDLRDRASLVAALDGAYGAFSVQAFFEEGVESETRQGKTLADAAREAHVKHLIYSSVGGAERKSGVPHFESKWQIEQHIRALGLPATILRPVAFMNNWIMMIQHVLDLEAGTFAQPLSPTTRLQQLAVDDIGAFAALAFANPEDWIGREIELAGDEPTMEETAAMFGRVFGQPIRYVQIPWDGFAAQAGEEMTTMYRWFEEKGYKADIGRLRKIHPPLMDLETFLAQTEVAAEVRR